MVGDRPGTWGHAVLMAVTRGDRRALEEAIRHPEFDAREPITNHRHESSDRVTIRSELSYGGTAVRLLQSGGVNGSDDQYASWGWTPEGYIDLSQGGFGLIVNSGDRFEDLVRTNAPQLEGILSQVQSEMQRKCRDAFTRIDQDEDGIISVQELCTALRSADRQWTRERAVQVLRGIDQNRDKKVSAMEFMTWILDEPRDWRHYAAQKHLLGYGYSVTGAT
eukprot:TRINITY_DN20056_c0_g1_i1.p1 TRINITY_DN20056_c0_g1~~TRINITY_DN20056_c0_g1_i1.p1  ORF type:complete len:221 (-),score=37.24 TRINITY_DN20056_c0_g1_i1:58-720(-)